MGCATSKQKVCENCQDPFSKRVPRRSKSLHVHVHHLPEKIGDSYHLVSLTSSTLGSLRLDPLHTNHYTKEEFAPPETVVGKVIEKKSNAEFVLVEAKTWSKMIEEKIPKVITKTPIQTPPNEPETINAWELMEGLEDTSPLSHLHDYPNHHLRSFSFPVQSRSKNSISYDDPTTPNVKQNVGQETTVTVLEGADRDFESHLHSDSTSIFDTDVTSNFREPLQKFPPAYPLHPKPSNSETVTLLTSKNVDREASEVKKINGIVEDYNSVAFVKEKLVLYFTSLRGVRKTYEDCCHIRVILKGLGVKIDERDVSMHSGFKDELKELLGEGYPGGGLPKLFIGTKFIGGAEEIRRMNEAGQVEKLVERCEKLDSNKTFCGGSGGLCDACGDVRFIPCDTCSGSCKIFSEGDFNEENEEDEYGFQRCPDCNENGLIRCPVCY